MDQPDPSAKFLPEKDFQDFFEESLCGFIIADSKGYFISVNKRISTWVGLSNEELKGKRLTDLLSIGGKIYYETHLFPLLRMQGFFEEVVLELLRPGDEKMQVMVSALERRNKTDNSGAITYTIIKASDRLQYENNLQQAKKIAEQELLKQKEQVALREQLIAVLGHDLRNPLSAITMVIQLMSISGNSDNSSLLATLKRSSLRMVELINNVMDFARTRLGEGIVLELRETDIKPILRQVVDEIKIVYPNREINTEFDIPSFIKCDPDRIGQLLSNLLANALTHGDTKRPVFVRAILNNYVFKLSVTNYGKSIPVAMQEKLFTPFTREINRPSLNGLGLGLYISSEIAKAHNAVLSFTSADDETCFTLTISL